MLVDEVGSKGYTEASVVSVHLVHRTIGGAASADEGKRKANSQN
jgi:hypothetical protein